MKHSSKKTIIVCAVNLVFCSSCSNNDRTSNRAPNTVPTVDWKRDVAIVVTPPTVHVEAFDPMKNRIYRKYHKFEVGYTTWDFHCRPEIKYYVCSTKDDPAGTKSIEIEVTGIKINLSTDIYEMYSSRATKFISAHEQGHVKICKDVYAHANDAAQQAAHGVLEGKFQGTGKTLEEALRIAVEAAAEAFCKGYRAKTSDIVANVSRRYDQIQDANLKMDPPTVVQQAQRELDPYFAGPTASQSTKSK